MYQMMIESRSPRIRHLSWGRVEVEGRHDIFKDAKLFPGGSCAWDWRATGTTHHPGIQPSDVRELLDHGATTVVLSTGILGRLRVSGEALALLRDRGIAYQVLRTPAAVQVYNDLTERERVAGLFHSTC